MIVKQPTLAELRRIAGTFGFEMTDADLASFQGLMAGVLASYARLNELVEPKPAVKYPRDSGYRPQPGRWPASASPSRTTSASPGCR